MTFRKVALMTLALAIAATATPALAQGRWGDQAKESRERRETAKAIRELEHPDANPAPVTPAPATPANTTAAAPATPDPATPANATAANPTPAPAQ